MGLKAARDAINPRPDTAGHFIFVGTGSHRALVSELTARRNQAFAGAASIAYPLLDEDYVDHLLERLRAEQTLAQGARLPSVGVATQAFRTLGARPEEMLRALREPRNLLPPGGDPDAFLPVIAGTLRSTAADVEIMKVEQLGALATAVFERIAGTEGRAAANRSCTSHFDARLSLRLSQKRGLRDVGVHAHEHAGQLERAPERRRHLQDGVRACRSHDPGLDLLVLLRRQQIAVEHFVECLHVGVASSRG